MPTRLGYLDYASGGTDPAHFDAAEAPDGAWLVAVFAWSDGTGANIQAVAPSGWTPLFGKQQIGTRAMQAWGRIKQPGDGVFAWNVSSGTSKYLHSMWGEGSAPVDDWVVGLVGVRNGGNAVPDQSVQAGTSTTTVCPPVDAPAGSLVLGLSVEATSAAETGVTNIAGATEWFFAWSDEVFSIETLSASYNEEVGGLTGPITVTYPNVQANNSGGFQLALPPAAEPEPEQPGIRTQLQDGRFARATVLVNGDRVTATRRILRPGFANVDQLLNTPGATWAHRGGSIPWPEMTEYAYDQSALRGYGVLEFSAQRTSDGWWFGLHDNDLDRTSGVSGVGPANTLTRAQVESHQVILNDGAPQPYYGMEEMLQKYAGTHVIVADPKNQLGHQNEFLDILDANGGPEHIIVKYFGVGGGSIALANAATARGYQTWGYFYQTNIASGDLQASQQYWSILGMEHSASQQSWDQVLSYGKPVAGHIAATQAHYDAAMAKGASMVQCSGVHVITPVGP